LDKIYKVLGSIFIDYIINQIYNYYTNI
jgi:hypothetical protein